MRAIPHDPQHSDDTWWKRAVVYQVYPRSFQDADGDGIGDVRGILQRVDYLAELGVDVVWLSPIYRSPQDDNGYDISDYQDIDPTFGTLEDVDELLTALHERGMRLVMDLVVNHTSDEHPWFIESRSSLESPKRDWYWWRPARDGMEPGTPGAEPTNWGSFFSGSTWELDDESGEYYLHLFSRKQPDLNWENPEVREAIYAMMRWWLDRGVDGFRMDVINLISKELGPDGSLPDAVIIDGPYGPPGARSTNGPRLHEFLQEMHREVFEGRRDGLLLVGETPGVTVEIAQLLTDPSRHEVDMVFTFEHVGLDHGPGGRFDVVPLDLRDLKATLSRWQVGLSEVGWNSLYWDNHDQPRAVSRFGDDRAHWHESATALAIILHLHQGTPYIYQGEEIGMTNAPFTSLEDYRDIESLRWAATEIERGRLTEEQVLAGLAAGSRDHARTPMQWDETTHAGFTTGQPWIAVNPNHTTINAAAAVADPGSVFHLYQRLIALRHDDPVVQHGDFRLLLPDDPHVYAFTRTLGDEELLVLGSFSGEEQTAQVGPGWENADLVIGNYSGAPLLAAGDVAAGDVTGGEVTEGVVTLRPWEAIVLRRVTG